MRKYNTTMGGRRTGKSMAELVYDLGEELTKEVIKIQQGTALPLSHAIDVVKMGLVFDDFSNEEYRLCKAYQLFCNDYSSFVLHCRSILALKSPNISELIKAVQG